MEFKFLQIKAHAHPSSRGDNSKVMKIYEEYFKNFYLRTKGPVSTKFGIKHPLVEGMEIFFQIKSHALLQGEIIATWADPGILVRGWIFFNGMGFWCRLKPPVVPGKRPGVGPRVKTPGSS